MLGPLALNLVIFVVALLVLLKGSDWFIDSAEKIGLSFGISPFVIGITIVAFGTSLPELATSIAAVLNGDSEIVIGNVIGSNIANIGLVLGLVAIVIGRINLEQNIWHVDMSYLWGSSFLLGFIIYDGEVSRLEGIFFLIGIVVFLMYSIGSQEKAGGDNLPKVTPKDYLLLLLGGVLVYFGATYVIVAIEVLSGLAGISKDTIALSAVALGTSLPEVVVSLSAAKKGKTSLAVGNVLGSNIFNVFVVTGISSMVGTLFIPPAVIAFSLPLMLGMTLLFGVMSNNQKITKWEGLLLLLFYIFYLVKLFAG